MSYWFFPDGLWTVADSVSFSPHHLSHLTHSGLPKTICPLWLAKFYESCIEGNNNLSPFICCGNVPVMSQADNNNVLQCSYTTQPQTQCATSLSCTLYDSWQSCGTIFPDLFYCQLDIMKRGFIRKWEDLNSSLQSWNLIFMAPWFTPSDGMLQNLKNWRYQTSVEKHSNQLNESLVDWGLHCLRFLGKQHLVAAHTAKGFFLWSLQPKRLIRETIRRQPGMEALNKARLISASVLYAMTNVLIIVCGDPCGMEFIRNEGWV